MKRRQFLATTSLALFATGCATSAQGAAEVDPQGLGPEAERLIQLYQEALAARENPIVIYGAAQEYYARAYEVFQRRFPGMTVRYQSIFGAPLIARLDQEFLSGARVGCIQLAAALPTSATVRAERTVAVEPFTADYLAANSVGPENAYLRFGYWPHGMEYNSTQLSADQAPRGLVDLIEPEWRGRLVMQNPTTNNATSNGIGLLMLRNLLDESWVEALAAQRPLIQSSVSLAEQVVARGERSVMVTNYDLGYASLRAKNVGVGFVFPPTEGTRFESQNVCVLADNPAPKSSELFLNWLFTPEGQQAMASVGTYPIDPSVSAPPTLPAIADMDPMIQEIPVAEIADASRETVAIMRKYFL